MTGTVSAIYVYPVPGEPGRALSPAVVTEAGLAAVATVTASLAADHRVSDGHTGAMFLASLHDWLQRPEDL